MAQLEQLLMEAASTSYGLVLRVSDFQLVQSKLYTARRAMAMPELATLQFRRSPTGASDELWIVKGSTPTSRVQAATQLLSDLDIDPADLPTKPNPPRNSP